MSGEERAPLLANAHEEDGATQQTQQGQQTQGQSSPTAVTAGSYNPPPTSDEPQTTTTTSASPPAADEAPPSYNAPTWFNSRPLGQTLPAHVLAHLNPSSTTDHPLAVTQQPQPQPPPPPLFSLRPTDPSAAATSDSPPPPPPPPPPYLGPRTITIPRGTNGFGFCIAGGNPAYVTELDVQGPAVRAGLLVGDRILEANGVDLKTADIYAVAALVQRCTTDLHLVVAAEPPTYLRPREQQESSAEPDRDFVLALQRMEEGNILDPTTPPPDYRVASCFSMICCPLVGAAAYWHANQAAYQWRINHHSQAYVHAATARKLAVAAVFYGLMMVLLYLFVKVDNSQR